MVTLVNFVHFSGLYGNSLDAHCVLHFYMPITMYIGIPQLSRLASHCCRFKTSIECPTSDTVRYNPMLTFTLIFTTMNLAPTCSGSGYCLTAPSPYKRKREQETRKDQFQANEFKDYVEEQRFGMKNYQ